MCKPHTVRVLNFVVSIFVFWLKVNFVGLYFRVELFSWTHGAQEAKSTSNYVAMQEL